MTAETVVPVNGAVHKDPIVETEAKVIAACIVKPSSELIVRIMDVIPNGGEFSNRSLGAIFDKVVELVRLRIAPTVLALANRLPNIPMERIEAVANRRDPELEMAGPDEEPPILTLARDVIQAAAHRRLRKAYQDASEILGQDGMDAQGAALLASQMIVDSVQVVDESDPNSGALLDGLNDEIAEMERQKRERGTDFLGFHTGVKWMDDLSGGMQKTHLWVLAARYKGRKTSTALNMLIGACRSGAVVDWFALEGEKRSQMAWIKAIVATDYLYKSGYEAEAELSEMWLKRNYLYGHQQEALAEAEREIRSWNLHIYDGEYKIRDVTRLENKIRRDKRINGLNIFFVDYAQVMTIPTRSGDQDDDTYRVMRRAALTFQGLSQEENLTAIVLSQQNEGAIGAVSRGEEAYSPGVKGGGDLPAAADFCFVPIYEKDSPDSLRMVLWLSRRTEQGVETTFRINRTSGYIAGTI